MSGTIKCGTFAAGAGSVSGLGFKPTAILFYTSNRTTNGYGAPAGAWEVANGYAARTNNDQVCGTDYWDGGFTGQTKTLLDRALEFPAYNVTNGRGTMRVSSYDSDGFSLSYPVTPTAAYLVGYIAFDAITAKTMCTMWGQTNPDSFTGFGFQPDFVAAMINGAGVNSVYSVQGNSPHRSVNGLSLAGRNPARTASPQMSVTRTNDVGGFSVLQSRSWGMNFLNGCWGATFQSCWSFNMASWDPDGFTLSQGNADQTQMALTGLAIKGRNLAVETGRIILPADGSDFTITPSLIPRAFMFFTHSHTDGGQQGNQFQTVATSTGCYDGQNQFHCGTGYNGTSQYDDRYCVKFDLAGTSNPLGLFGKSIEGSTLTLGKSRVANGNEPFVWMAIGLSPPPVLVQNTVSMYMRGTPA